MAVGDDEGTICVVVSSSSSDERMI